MISVEYCVKNFTPAFTPHRLAMKWSAFLKFISCIASFKAFLVGEKRIWTRFTKWKTISLVVLPNICENPAFCLPLDRNEIEVFKIYKQHALYSKVSFSVCLWHLDGKTAKLELFGFV